MKKVAPAVSILQVSDMHIMPTPSEKFYGVDTEWSFHAVLEQAFAENKTIDLILLTGDLVQQPDLSSYQRILTTLETYRTPCLCLPGNHDDDKLMQQVLNAGDIHCKPQVFLENWQIICLNSRIPGEPGGHLAAGELSFLEDCLRKNPSHPTLIAVHHHCLKIDSDWMDTMMIDNSRDFFSVVTQYPQVKAITCGHIHQAIDCQVESIRILSAPSTCIQFTPASREFSIDDTAPGYRMIDLYADGCIETSISYLKHRNH
ncbi:MAG: 3',5'-cyclic-AMP phosphodiesterase [Methylosarcina sp.]